MAGPAEFPGLILIPRLAPTPLGCRDTYSKALPSLLLRDWLLVSWFSCETQLPLCPSRALVKTVT